MPNTTSRQCRSCAEPLRQSFCDLGMSPLSNAYLRSEQLGAMERFYPLHAYVCERCMLVQVEEFESPASIFSDYAYFSSYSSSWVSHAERYAADMVARFPLSQRSCVVEVASNDGYLLQFFKQRGIPVLGIEPAGNVAQTALQKGIDTRVEFFGAALARQLREEQVAADLLAGNNVLAHVPDINDFVAGMQILLAPEGVITLEFPHLLQLMAGNQFDTIYHEHFSYLSLLALRSVFARHGLRVFDVTKLSTHGGSLRVFVCHDASRAHAPAAAVDALIREERAAGLDNLQTYRSFAEQVRETKRRLLTLLIDIKRRNKSIVGYGAAAKGNTLLNYCGVRTDFIDYVVDANPHKQGLYLPGSHIPILSPDVIRQTRPDFVLILPWNLTQEIVSEVSYIRQWGGQFVVPIPAATVLA